MGEAHHRDARAREITSASRGEVSPEPEVDLTLLGCLGSYPWLWFWSYFRLELLLQIANKIQNGALNCEEKLTLAKNTLQAVSLWLFCLPSCVTFFTSRPGLQQLKLTFEASSCATSLLLEFQWPLGTLVLVGGSRGVFPLFLSLSPSGRCSPGVRTTSAVRVGRRHVHSGMRRSHQAAASGSPDPPGWELLPARRAGF